MPGTLELLECRRDQEVTARMDLLLRLGDQVERLLHIYQRELLELQRLLTPAS